MVNEAARCIEESVVANADHLDMAMIMGTGFPPFRGGLCAYANDRGIDKCIDQLEILSDTVSDRFNPSKLLYSMRESNTQFDI